uniref:Si:dkey-24l11.2 n=1 Tax=Hippocampus comes TaxID=109280 RepID=A0A3Q2XWI8_HIPCM
MLHHYSDVLGYLDLQNAVPTDLVLQDCHLTVGCLSCSQESFVQNLCYGQIKEVNCDNCHGKLSLLAESARFQYIQPRSNKTAAFYSQRDPAVQKGKPLPEKGACKHYKQSHRWLRFPCCGRAYPCDVCHDEDQDHPMELANRMICGYCAKEQVSSALQQREAVRQLWQHDDQRCSHQNDRQKYANTNKTISKKAIEKK